jgi:predicted nucleic acid-binding Zn ribbon protein
MNHHYCPLCYAEIPIGAIICPDCGRDIEDWERHTPYYDRLIWALKNPHSEVRMGAILSLQNHGREAAAGPLAECAMGWPTDVVQGMAVVAAIAKLPESVEKTADLRQLQQHKAHAIRVAAEELLTMPDPI